MTLSCAVSRWWSRGKETSVVCAASYEARKFGVRSAMPAIRAERLCPQAIFVPPDFTRYRAVSQSTREIFKRHTDLIEPLSLDEAYLDVTENKTGLPTATKVARTIREQIREELHLTASAGVAPNKFLAKIASDWRKPDGLFVIQPEDLDEFLPPLPIGRIPGVGKVTEKRLAELGIKTVGDMRRLELNILEDNFGRYGLRLSSSLVVSTIVRSFRTGRQNPSPPKTLLKPTCRYPRSSPSSFVSPKRSGRL